MRRITTRGVDARWRDESGVALVMALGFLLLLSLGFATSIVLTSAGARHAFSSNADQKAYALAEEGVNNAIAVIFTDANKAAAKDVDCADPTTYATYQNLLPPRTMTRPEGSVTWHGTLDCVTDPDHPFWKVEATSTVMNPTGPGTGAVTRKATANIPLDATEGEVVVVVPGGSTIETTTTSYETVETTTPGTTTTTSTSTVYDPFWTGGAFLYSQGDVDLTGGSSTEQAIIADGNVLFGGGGWVAASAVAISVRGTIDAGGAHSLGMSPTTILTSKLEIAHTTALVKSTAAFPAAGTIKINSEYMTYTGKTATSFTGLTRGVHGTTPAVHPTSGGIVSGGPPPMLTAPMSATQTTASVTWVPSTTTNDNPNGFRTSVPSGDTAAGMFRIANSENASVEFIKYTGIGTTTAACSGQPAPCFTGLSRGYVPGYPAAAHATGAEVDGRLRQVITRGGCVDGCGAIHSSTPVESGPGANLIQDDPAFTKPVFNIVQAKNDAAPGPAHAPSPTCAISFAGIAANPYYRGGEIDLTPTTSYTCTATGGGYADGTGELSWNNTTKVLKVRGVVFLPTDVKTTQDARYDAPTPGAVLFVGGKFGTGKKLCGKAIVGGTCDQSWNPNIDSNLAIVGLNVPAGYSNPVHKFTFSSGSFFQGLVYTDGDMEATGGAVVSGTAFAKYIKYGGGGVAPAPGLFAVPTGFGTPRTVTTTTTIVVPVVVTVTNEVVSTYTTTIDSPTTVTVTGTVRAPGTPRDFGG